MSKNTVNPIKKRRSVNEKTSLFFQKVKRRRKELRITQVQLASLLGIDQSRISALENGTFVESPERIEMLARALETTPDYLFGFREEP